MDNLAILKEMGFFEKDGYLCNPYLQGEGVFKLDAGKDGFENKPLSWILQVISATASNAGYRHGRKTEKEQVINVLEKELKKTIKNLKKP